MESDSSIPAAFLRTAKTLGQNLSAHAIGCEVCNLAHRGCLFLGIMNTGHDEPQRVVHALISPFLKSKVESCEVTGVLC
jgi:hypothetical protein